MRSPLVRSSGAVAEHATPSLGATRTAVVGAGRLPYACSSLFAAVSAARGLVVWMGTVGDLGYQAVLL